jgi:hypothetical protein
MSLGSLGTIEQDDAARRHLAEKARSGADWWPGIVFACPMHNVDPVDEHREGDETAIACYPYGICLGGGRIL